MRQAKILPGAFLYLAAVGLAVTGTTIPERVYGQVYPQCPAGYYYDSNYGCVPLSYFYGPPDYVYPDSGFGFFYGGGWGGRGYAPRGGGPHGGGHVGGGGQVGGGGHGGGHR